MNLETPHPADTTSGFARHRAALTALALMVLAWLIYLPSTRFDFVYFDDIRILHDHPELYGQPQFSANLRAIFQTSFPREEPLLLRDVAWAVDARLFGFDNPFGYHLGNVLLHGGVVALVFGFLLTTTRRYGFALLTAAAFLLLAVHVEPVAWIMGRKDLMSSLFMLLAFCAQTRRLHASAPGARWLWYAGTLLCFVAALLSKINVLTFPVVLFCHAVLSPWLSGERAVDAPFEWNRRLVRELALAIPLLLVSGAIYIWYQGILAAVGLFDRGYQAHGLAHLWNLLMVNPLVLGLYLKQVFLPSNLALLYTWPDLQPAYPAWQVATGLLTLLGCAAIGWWLARRRKDLLFFFAAFFVLMIPYSNLIFIGIWAADRYLYFSGICVLALAMAAGLEGWRRAGRPGRLALLALGFGLGTNNLCQTLAYQPAWRDGETLWSYHVAHTPENPTVFANLAAYYYAGFGRATAAHDQVAMTKSLRKMELVVNAGLARFWPDHAAPPPPNTYFLFFLRSLIEQVTDQPEAALKSLLLADGLRPNFDSINLNLARLYRQLGEASQDARQRSDYLRSARDRFGNYLRLTFRNRPPPPALAAEQAALATECAKLSLTPTP